MQFKDGADILTPSGDKVGSLERVVLDPQTREVSHLVIGRGFLLPTEKVIPIGWIASSDTDQITLKSGHGDLEAAPEFTETDFVPIGEARRKMGHPDGDAEPVLWYPPVGAIGWASPMYPVPPYVARIEQNIPEGTITLKEGAKVFSADGEHIGNIDRLYTEPKDQRITHLLLSKGFLFEQHKLIPAIWIRSLQEDEVHLAVESDVIKSIPHFPG